MNPLRAILWFVTGVSLGCFGMAVYIDYERKRPYEVTWWPPQELPAHDVSPP